MSKKTGEMMSKVAGETIKDLASRVEMGYIPMEDLTPQDRRLVKKYQKEEAAFYLD